MGRRLLDRIAEVLRAWQPPSWTPAALDPYGIFAAMHAADDEAATIVRLETPNAPEPTPERATA